VTGPTVRNGHVWNQSAQFSSETETEKRPSTKSNVITHGSDEKPIDRIRLAVVHSLFRVISQGGSNWSNFVANKDDSVAKCRNQVPTHVRCNSGDFSVK
jgi:hypothetical protein